MNTRTLTKGQIAVLTAAAVAMLAVGTVGAVGTYGNVVSEFHRRATAGGVVASGEGLTLILSLIMLGRTMLGMASPAAVRAGLWLAPVSASFTGLAIADSVTESAVYAVTPLAMSGAAEGLGLIARSIVVYRTGVDAETMRRNADVARRLAYERAVADSHPGKLKKKWAVRRYWRLAQHVGVGDAQLGAGLVDVQRTRVRDGADAALASMYGVATPPALEAPAEPSRPASATERLRTTFADMDPAAAIRLAADARPDADVVELAAILSTYGLAVDPVAVAVVLGERPAEYEVHRPDAPVAPQVSPSPPALPALSLQGAVEEAATALGPDATARDIAARLEETRRLVVPENHIRSALSRAAKKPAATPRNDPMKGGYN
ncbi:conjugal transfer protein [Streptomyces sp. NPDC090119]|uniref:conjugal transfer protein n=1 Tax=Streptomyces sp. NPDC090119 TaxID=3365951 RepID=UPI0037FA0774